MSISLTFYIPAEFYLSRLYVNGGCYPWAVSICALADAATEHVVIDEIDPSAPPEDNACAVMTVAEILAVRPSRPGPGGALEGARGRSAVAYLRTLPPETRVAVHAS